MTEEKWETLYQIAMMTDRIAEISVAAACLLYLCQDHIRYRTRTEKHRKLLLTGAVFWCVYLGVFAIPGVGGYTATAAGLAAAFLICCLTDRGRSGIKAVLLGTFLVLDWMAFAMANTIAAAPFRKMDMVIYRMAGGENPSLQLYYFISFCVYLLLEFLLSGAVLFLAVKKIRQALGGMEELGTQETLLLLIPAVNGMVAHGIFGRYKDAFERETGNAVYQIYPAIDFWQILYYAIILISIISMIALIRKIQKRREEECERALLESRLRDMQLHIEQVEGLYTDIRSVKHDIKNHVEVISGLLAQGETDRAREYAMTLSAAAESLDFPIKTGNPVTDVILREKQEQARKKGLVFASDFHYPTDAGINAFDVSVVLSNALSNAIEAAEAGGDVSVSSFRNKNAYLITVENSFAGELESGVEGGLPETKKEDRTSHGFGLRNMRAVAAKYYGDVQMEQREGRVVVTILLLARS